ncbi:DUF2339 domain-containing protein [Motilimonas pumila]|uniref:DUF2339 domain-containing protein n=1 Tax=Motilimonas pumila TaxID=2303987 RepID=A0A418YE65_9GAMM|nr:DUF2339 domain-containing protein [Motilimonas pumila]RJG47420.1 DUF2339 domain-containing protein [Motilimonas pumila]
MDSLLTFFGLAVMAFLFGGAGLAWYSFSQLKQANRRIDALNQAVTDLKQLLAKSDATQQNAASAPLQPVDEAPASGSPVESALELATESELRPPKEGRDSLACKAPNAVVPVQVATHSSSDQRASDAANTSEKKDRRAVNNKDKPPHPAPSHTPRPSLTERFEAFIANNGLLWIGGAILALGGVFLAKYSVEAGLVSIATRLVFGGVFAAALVLLAEYLYRKQGGQSGVLTTCAALASGGVITGFALVLVTFTYYQFISSALAFAGLAFISLLATALALRYGPLLAVIGIIGAYAVPALVNTDSNNLFALLMYVNLVSCAAMWVAQKVQKDWLWWQSFTGHFLWLAVSIAVGESGDIWLIFATMVVGLYLYIVAGVLGWRFSESNGQALAVKVLLMPRKEQLAIILSVMGLVAFYALHGFAPSLIWVCALLAVLCAWLPLRHSAFDAWPFVALAFCGYVIMMYPLPASGATLSVFAGAFGFTQFAAWLCFGYGWFMMKRYPKRLSYCLFSAVSSLCVFGLSYVISPLAISAQLYPLWSGHLLVMAAAAIWLGQQGLSAYGKAALWVLANTHLALVLSMWLNASTLTLALCGQLVLLAYYQKSYQLAFPSWLTKIGLSLVLLRVTLAPFTPEYSQENVLSVHWSLVVLPLMLAFIFAAYRLQTNRALKNWLEGALMHLLALFVTLETSYYLIGDYPSLQHLSFKEMAALSMNWLVLGTVYWWRYRISQRDLYLIAGSFLAGASGILHVAILWQYNPWFSAIDVGPYLLFNWVSVLWLVPLVMLSVALKYGLIPARLQLDIRFIYGLIALFCFLFVNATVRTVFQQQFIMVQLTTSQAELYTYSAVWLLIAASLVVLGQRLAQSPLYQSGFAILLVVILKAFLVDMAHLDGLYRAISFIGLGLSLVGLGWLFTRVRSH